MPDLLKTEFENELNSILSWWSRFMPDAAAGFYGKVDIHNNVDASAERGLVLYSRLLYTFSKAAYYLKEEKYSSLADKAYNYLRNHFYDQENQGYYWSVDADGTPKDTIKKTYGQSFVIYSFCAYYDLNQQQEVLEHAIDLFHTIESKTKDPQFGGYIEAFAKDWQPVDDIRLSDKDANLPKSMNTHLHVLEAYTALYKSSKETSVGTALAVLINLFIQHIVCHRSYHLHLFFTLNWTVASSIWSYGHDIEASWLLIKAADAYGDAGMQKDIYAVSLKILEASLEGIDGDGGILYEIDYSSNQLNTEKHWWPQAEAMVGCWYGYRQTADQKYHELMQGLWTYIQQNLIDHSSGEWFWGKDEDGNILHPDEKAGFWKCPYHNSRALMELIYNEY